MQKVECGIADLCVFSVTWRAGESKGQVIGHRKNVQLTDNHHALFIGAIRFGRVEYVRSCGESWYFCSIWRGAGLWYRSQNGFGWTRLFGLLRRVRCGRASGSKEKKPEKYEKVCPINKQPVGSGSSP